MKQQRKALYEGMYILNATLSEDLRKKALDRVTQSVLDQGGEIHKIHEQGRKKLAYPIQGRREGFYYLVYFTAPTLSIPAIWREYQLHEDLIRFMTMRVDEVLETLEFKPLRREDG